MGSPCGERPVSTSSALRPWNLMTAAHPAM
jgi:hypothetical protein